MDSKDLFLRIDELDISTRSATCLCDAGIEYVGDLVQKTDAELLHQRNLGRKSLKEIHSVLRGLGLDVGMTLATWHSDLAQFKSSGGVKRDNVKHENETMALQASLSKCNIERSAALVRAQAAEKKYTIALARLEAHGRMLKALVLATNHVHAQYVAPLMLADTSGANCSSDGDWECVCGEGGTRLGKRAGEHAPWCPALFVTDE